MPIHPEEQVVLNPVDVSENNIMSHLLSPPPNWLIRYLLFGWHSNMNILLSNFAPYFNAIAHPSEK